MFKFILVGNTSVGKSCMLLRFKDSRFQEHMSATLGVDFGSQMVTVADGSTIKVQVWDTAGQEEFRAITRAYYREAAAAIIVYDITDRRSFRKVQSWLSAVQGHATADQIAITVVGNKVDLGETKKRQVSTEEGEAFVREQGLGVFVEASAKTGAECMPYI
jgi:small GTP-binding protein